MKLQDIKRGKYLIVLLVIGIILRCILLFSKSIWFDEAASMVMAQMPLLKLFSNLANMDFNPPLYFVLLHLWMKISSNLHFLEVFSVIFGAASIVIIYKLGNLLYKKPVGVYAAFIFAISCLNVRYSQEIRMYALAVFLALLSTYFFMRMLYEDWKSVGKRDFVLYLVTMLAGLYTHYYVFFLLLCQNAYFFLFYKDRALTKKWIIGQLLLALGYAAWLPSMLMQVTHMQQDFWIAKPTFTSLITTFIYMADNILGSIVIGILVLGGLFSLYRIHKGKLTIRKEKQNFFLLITLVVPVLLSFAISLMTKSLFYERYFIIFSPFLYLLAAKGLSHIGNRIVLALFFVLLLVSNGMYLIPYYHSVSTDIEKGADFVAQNAQDKGIIIHVNPFVYLPLESIIRRGYANTCSAARSFPSILGEIIMMITFMSRASRS